MERWEYLNVTFKCGIFGGGPTEVTKFCNQYGQEGWEMVNFCFDSNDNLMCFIFKRKLHD